MKRKRYSTTRSRQNLDSLFSSVAGVVRLAARRYFLRWLGRERESLLFLPPRDRARGRRRSGEVSC